MSINMEDIVNTFMNTEDAINLNNAQIKTMKAQIIKLEAENAKFEKNRSEFLSKSPHELIISLCDELRTLKNEIKESNKNKDSYLYGIGDGDSVLEQYYSNAMCVLTDY